MGIEHGGLPQTLSGSGKRETQKEGSLAFPDLDREDMSVSLCVPERQSPKPINCQLELMKCVLDQTAQDSTALLSQRPTAVMLRV